MLLQILSKKCFRNSDYDGQEIVFEESDDTIHYVIGEPIEYEQESNHADEYEYVYEEAEETIDDPPEQEADVVEEEHNVTEDEDDAQERKKLKQENKGDGIEIKKEDETAECDICNKVFRTTAVIVI